MGLFSIVGLLFLSVPLSFLMILGEPMALVALICVAVVFIVGAKYLRKYLLRTGRFLNPQYIYGCYLLVLGALGYIFGVAFGWYSCESGPPDGLCFFGAFVFIGPATVLFVLGLLFLLRGYFTRKRYQEGSSSGNLVG